VLVGVCLVDVGGFGKVNNVFFVVCSVGFWRFGIRKKTCLFVFAQWVFGGLGN
jgi:hypothetical protein